jgi:hypothetical protein
MKFNKLALAAAFSAALVTSASATTHVLHLYGSTAYRKATFEALNTLMTNGFVIYDTDSSTATTPATVPTSSASLPIASPTSTEVGSTNTVFVGNMPATFGSDQVIVYANWAGSVAGISSLADPANANANPYFFPNTNLSQTVAALDQTSSVDVAMSDCDQITTSFDQTTDPNATELTVVGLPAVLEFAWCRGASAPTTITNAGIWSIEAILGQGHVPVSQFTGNSSDASSFLYVTGRNNDSGTRILALTDSFYGAGNTVKQYTGDGGAFQYQGDGGYSSGGSVATVLEASYTGYKFDGTHPSSLIGYISLTDAVKAGDFTLLPGFNSVTNSHAVANSQFLTYNGVGFSEPAIIQGAYTYFGYEHMYTLNVASTTDAYKFSHALEPQQALQAGDNFNPGTMPLGLMQIGQRDDGAVIAHN